MLIKNQAGLRQVFDLYATHNFARTPFISPPAWRELLDLLGLDFSDKSISVAFGMSRHQVALDAGDAVPGLTYPEFLEALARLSRMNLYAAAAVDAFSRRATVGNTRFKICGVLTTKVKQLLERSLQRESEPVEFNL